MSSKRFDTCGICRAGLSDARTEEYIKAAEVAPWIGAALCEECANHA